MKDIDRDNVTFSLTSDAPWGELVLPATQVDGEPEKTEIILRLNPVDIHGGTFAFDVTANDGSTEITQNLSVTVSNVNDHVIFVTEPPNIVVARLRLTKERLLSMILRLKILMTLM